MSSKRNKSNKDDNFFMDQALSLASQNLGLTGENPSVGCVLIKGNQTISVGVTGINGKPHAEVNAIIMEKPHHVQILLKIKKLKKLFMVLMM